MTFHEVNTRLDQPMEHDIHRGLINPCIHRNWKPLTVLLYDIKSNLSQYSILLNNKEFRFFLIGLSSIFSTLPQSEYTSRAVSTPCVRYIRACVYFYLLSIRCFNAIQPETRFHFQSANQIAKKVDIFKNFKTSKFYKI